jgi:hypothetical protein
MDESKSLEGTDESPYLPDGRQWAWNSTALGWAKECKRKYYLSQHLNLAKSGDNVHLVFGGHYAKALERYHRFREIDALAHEDALRATVADLLIDTKDWHPEHNFKNRDTLIRSVVWYLEEIKDDACKTVVLASGRPAVELPFRFQVQDDIWLAGHLDRLVEYAGDYYVQDQKTTGSTLSPYYFNRFNPDNQMSLYTVAAEVFWQTPVKGVMIDAAQIAVGFTRFARSITTRTKAQAAEWLETAVYHIEETWRCHEKNFWPMNDKACGLYGGCPFVEVCSKDARVQQDFLRTYETYINNPLKDRQ